MALQMKMKQLPSLKVLLKDQHMATVHSNVPHGVMHMDSSGSTASERQGSFDCNDDEVTYYND